MYCHRGARQGSYLVAVALTRLDEEEFGLPCQGGGSATPEGLRQLLQKHFCLITAKDTPLFSVGKDGYDLTEKTEVAVYQVS